MVILPFHQRWSAHGEIAPDDKNIRSTNLMVLLVGRASIPRDSSVRLAMVFLGGADDREALCLGKRATRNPRINLVVNHLVVQDKSAESNLENIRDNAVLKDVRQHNSALTNVAYREIFSNDGAQTTFFLLNVVNEHDYFIFGRWHDVNTPKISGLTHWNIFPELGIIGDLLASFDYGCRASFLGVQQEMSNTQK